MAERFRGKIQFAHLRNVAKEPDGSFMEAEHLGGDVDMVAVVTSLLEEQGRRRDAGDPRWQFRFAPTMATNCWMTLASRPFRATRRSAG